MAPPTELLCCMSPLRQRLAGRWHWCRQETRSHSTYPGRTLTLEVAEEALLGRRPNAATPAGFANPVRGWERLYIDHVQQADTGAGLNFLVDATGDHVSRNSH